MHATNFCTLFNVLITYLRRQVNILNLIESDLMPVETRIRENSLYKATTVIAAADQIAFHILGVLEAFFGIETHNFAVQWPDRG
ncbi:unnamed protein product [Camellia sinensis]